MRVCFILLLLSTLAYTAAPARAQERQDRARRLLQDVRETDRATSNSAREWALDRGLPMRVRQSDGRMVELVAMDDGRPIYLTAANSAAASVTGTSHLYPGGRLGLDLTGAGLLLGIWDEGHALGTHVELADRVTYGDNSETSLHATHVAGTLAASGVDERARGMAYEALVTSYDWKNDATEMSDEAEEGLLLSNHSYTTIAGWHYGDIEGAGEDQWYWLGDPNVSETEDFAFGRYDLRAVQYDRIAYANPYYLPVIAAGNDRHESGPSSGTFRALNRGGTYQDYDVGQRGITPDGGADGFDTITGGSVAKNVLTIGSAAFSAVTNSVRMSGFSSFGPTDDGRIKPDLVGIGENVYSLSSDGAAEYARSSGTSMAAPNVTGSILLLQQQFEETFGRFMLASTLKGLLLHTATDLGRPGPDYSTGWGLLNTEAAARQISAAAINPIGIYEDEIVDGDQFGRHVVVDEPGPLRVTLSWTDHPSARIQAVGSAALDNRTPHLRNDLDVRLVNQETGEIYLPYVLDVARPEAGAFPGDNKVDPIEQVFVADAEPGTYTLTVTHKGDLLAGLPQAFSIIVSGAVDESAPVSVAHLTADVSLDRVRLTWRTLFEREAGRFVVERAQASLSPSKRVSDEDFVAVGEIAGGSERSSYEFVDSHSIAGRYVYRLMFAAEDGSFEVARTDVNRPAPDSYTILSNYPNPFRDRTTIEVDLPKSQHVFVGVYDVRGRQMAQVHDGTLPAGRHRIPLDGGNWPAGLYFARVETPSGVATHKMVLVR